MKRSLMLAAGALAWALFTIPANAIDVQTTPGNPGFFDLLIGSSPLASEFLLADLEEVTITYLDGSSTAQFNFGAALTDTFAANLPFGLQIDDPITISFSAQVVAGTRTDDGTFITGFDARGTGEYSGAVVPEPSTGLLVLLTAAGLSLRRR